jgi:divalent metal cation (Fe/Co/Zn/Cd) transporter
MPGRKNMDDSQWGHIIKDWLDSTWIGYCCFVFLAFWGGTAGYISRVRRKKLKWSTAEWIGEMVISGLAGMLAGLLGVWLEWPPVLVLFASGISGHMGGRALFLFDELFTVLIDRAKTMLGVKPAVSTEADDR